MKILTAEQMGRVDHLTSERFRIPSLLLMENAGRSVADVMEKAIPNLRAGRILVICGKGNNGGDGFVVARYLFLRGARPEILLLAEPGQLRRDAQANWEMVSALGIPLHILPTPAKAISFLRKIPEPDVLVDALFGTGLSKPIGADFRPIIGWINKTRARAAVVSVDIPSGLFADSHFVPGIAVHAHHTVTFTALKLALVLPPASDYAGEITVAPIGSPASLLENPEHNIELMDPEAVIDALPRRIRDSHKGTYGHVFVLAGSKGKSGAALMTGLAALRSGAGLVTLWLPASLQRDIAGKIPELMTEFMAENAAGTADRSGAPALLSRLAESDVLVIGPGLTTAGSTPELVLELVRDSSVPVVVDADGINAFAAQPELLLNAKGQPLVITPHPGEMARLLRCSIKDIQRDRVQAARSAAARHSCYTVLKGWQTVVAAPNGVVLINPTGNPGMATGGSGDILAGMVGCFVGRWRRRFQGANPDALLRHIAAAVYLHGLAGDLAAAAHGMESLIATDLLPQLPEAFKRVIKNG